MAREFEWRVPVTSTLGVGTGLTISEFISEFAARVTGQAGWRKLGLKGGIKFTLGMLFYAISLRIAGIASLFLEVMGYSAWGSWMIDWLYLAVPGGVWGAAEAAAAAVRVGLRKVEKAVVEVETEKAEAEKAVVPVEAELTPVTA